MNAKERREKLKLEGICIECGKTPAEFNRVKCAPCAQTCREANKRYRQNNPHKVKERRIKWKTDPNLRNKTRVTRKAWRLKYKYKVIVFLGGKCECCNESNLEFLQVDHINQDGKKHRKEVGRGIKIFRDMYKNPNKYKLRILCANCHFAITNLGNCPHKNCDELSKVQSDVPFSMVRGSD